MDTKRRPAEKTPEITDTALQNPKECPVTDNRRIPHVFILPAYPSSSGSSILAAV